MRQKRKEKRDGERKGAEDGGGGDPLLEGFWEILGPTDIYEAQPLEVEPSLVSPLKTHRRKTSICWQDGGAAALLVSTLKAGWRAPSKQASKQASDQ